MQSMLTCTLWVAHTTQAASSAPMNAVLLDIRWTVRRRRGVLACPHRLACNIIQPGCEGVEQVQDRLPFHPFVVPCSRNCGGMVGLTGRLAHGAEHEAWPKSTVAEMRGSTTSAAFSLTVGRRAQTSCQDRQPFDHTAALRGNRPTERPRSDHARTTRAGSIASGISRSFWRVFDQMRTRGSPLCRTRQLANHAADLQGVGGERSDHGIPLAAAGGSLAASAAG
jgi:hypothetical protein